MTASTQGLTERPAWKSLDAHHQQVRGLHLRKLFADDPRRGERMAVDAVGLYLDYSKNRATDETLKLLIQLAEETGVCALGWRPCSGARKSTLRKTERSCMWLCARHAGSR